jgi:hypothetical protein
MNKPKAKKEEPTFKKIRDGMLLVSIRLLLMDFRPKWRQKPRQVEQ